VKCVFVNRGDDDGSERGFRTMTLRVGIVGFGLAGRYFHAPLIAAAGMRVHGIVTSRADEVRRLHADAVVLSSPEALLARDDIDLVVVASPSQFHFSQAHDALLAGKHVVVDKPVSITASEAQSLARLARDRKLKLAVFQNRRWDGDFLTVQKLLREQRLGEIAAFHARWNRFRPEVQDRWRERAEPGSGMLYDLGSHLIDQVLCLFGRPDWIQADVFAQRRGAVADDGFEILMAKGSLRISLGVSSLAANGDWRYCIHGSRASYFKTGLDPQEDQTRGGMQITDAGFGVEAAERSGRLVMGADGSVETIPTERGRWLTFYEHMKSSIENDAPVPVPAEEAATVLEVIEAARRSSDEGRRLPLHREPRSV